MADGKMVILIDSNYFVSLLNKDDTNHARANIIFDDLLGGTYGTRITTNFILDEAITVTWVRTKNKNIVNEVYSLFIGKEAITLVHAFPLDMIPDAWHIFNQYADLKRPLSFTDCTNISYIKKRGIDYMLSFDGEFDGIVSRIC